ncbi:MAG: cytochrome c assembly protein, partial [Saprospiraceae bacterium]|nr:cytochrome c assembly protein [Saprospiraceae bacterium]
VDTVDIADRDTFITKQYRIRLIEIDRRPTHPDYDPTPRDLAVGLQLAVEREDEDSVFMAKPVLVLRGDLLYSYPVQINELSTKVRLDEGIFEQLFTTEDELDYEEFTIPIGGGISYNGYQIKVPQLDRQVEHPTYEAEEGDIAVSAVVDITAPSGEKSRARPVFLIRQSRPFNLKDQAEEARLHFRFAGLDPTTESITLLVAQAAEKQGELPIEIATDSLRSDYIVLEAIAFPGINFFWLGSSLLMFGLGFSMWHRLRHKSLRK